MIIVTRLNGPAFAMNPDLIERAEATPDTVVTLVDGTKYVIAEPMVALIALIRDYRASVIAAAHAHEVALGDEARTPLYDTAPGQSTVVALHSREH